MEVEEEEEEYDHDEVEIAAEDEDAEELPRKIRIKKKLVEKTIWDWFLVNDNKPIWAKKWVIMLNCVECKHYLEALTPDHGLN